LAFTGFFTFQKLSANRVGTLGEKVLEPIKIIEKPLQTPKSRYFLLKPENERGGSLCPRRPDFGEVTDVDGKTKQDLLELVQGEPF